MLLTEFGREYLLLGLRMDKLIDKYVDSYFGPLELKQEVKHEVKQKKLPSPDHLLDNCRRLQKDLPDQGFEKSRVNFLEKMLFAMESSLELELGVKIPYIELVKRLYDMQVEYRTDSELYEGVEKLDSLYNGSGTLLDRISVVYKRRALPKDKILEFCRHGMDVVRKRTYELFPDLLPEGEREEVKEVHRKPWQGYNWYKGDFESRFDLCTDRRISWHQILDINAHEAYPGHHSESCVKDKLLYQEKDHFEQCMRIVHSPQSVLYEGTAAIALDTLFTLYEQETILYKNYCLYPSEENFDALMEERKVWKSIHGIFTNLAFHLHVDEWSEKKLFAFILQLGIYPESEIQGMINFVKDPMWKTYQLNYFVGERLIKRKYGQRLSPKDFTDLLVNSYLPSDFN